MTVGDFNIHVCRSDKPLVQDFLTLIRSFNLVQSVTGPAHQHGHTLDLVSSCGLSVLTRKLPMLRFPFTILFYLISLLCHLNLALLQGALVHLTHPWLLSSPLLLIIKIGRCQPGVIFKF